MYTIARGVRFRRGNFSFFSSKNIHNKYPLTELLTVCPLPSSVAQEESVVNIIIVSVYTHSARGGGLYFRGSTLYEVHDEHRNFACSIGQPRVNRRDHRRSYIHTG